MIDQLLFSDIGGTSRNEDCILIASIIVKTSTITLQSRAWGQNKQLVKETFKPKRGWNDNNTCHTTIFTNFYSFLCSISTHIGLSLKHQKQRGRETQKMQTNWQDDKRYKNGIMDSDNHNQTKPHWTKRLFLLSGLLHIRRYTIASWLDLDYHWPLNSNSRWIKH